MSACGFPKALHLRTQAHFKRVFGSNRCFRTKYWIVLFIPNAYTYPRLGLSVAKKNIPTAVGRNRIKRLIRESFRAQQGALANLDIVIVVRKLVGSTDNTTISKQLTRSWHGVIEQANNFVD
ncbi:MAG: ribonuclease P protein component [Legionellales bacterium]|nr:MAG: ribonuclease P protein component [Legionellales bacterium]